MMKKCIVGVGIPLVLHSFDANYCSALWVAKLPKIVSGVCCFGYTAETLKYINIYVKSKNICLKIYIVKLYISMRNTKHLSFRFHLLF